MPKLRAVEVTCSDGSIITVHEPRIQDLAVWLRALPSLTMIGRAFQDAGRALSIIGVPLDIPDSAVEGIYPLFAIMCSITVEEFKALSVYDGIAVIGAFGEFAPNEQPAAQTDSASTPSTPTLPD